MTSPTESGFSTVHDLVLTGGRVLDVAAKQVVRADVAVRDGRIVAVGTDGARFEARETIDVAGRFIAPGFIDSHMHIESTLLTPVEFAAFAVSRGTTAVFVDPHEIANVSGRRGIDFVLDEADVAALDIWVGIPSCVPATRLEDSGASIELEDIRELLPRPRVFGLAEMMNFPAIIGGIGDARDRVDVAHDHGKIVDGHAPGVGGRDLELYATNGHCDGVIRIRSDHECTTAAEAIEKHEAGMTVALRFGSAARDLDRILPGVIERYGNDLDGFMLCSDDVDPIELDDDGHVDRLIRRARDIMVTAGVEPELAAIQAVRMATLEPARYFADAIERDGRPGIGEIAVGKKADMVVLGSLEDFAVEQVIRDGVRVVEQGRFIGTRARVGREGLTETVRLRSPISPSDLRIPAAEADGERVDVRVVGARGDSLATESLVVSVEVRDGGLQPDPVRDLAKLAVFERHTGSGGRAVGFVQGLGLRRGAIASTVAHDSHNLIVAGVDDAAIAAVANRLAEIGGGLAVAVDGRVTDLPLPVGGLMSGESLVDVAAGLRTLLEATRTTGTALDSPYMTLSFLALPVIPRLKLSNRGLVDVEAFEHVALRLDGA